MTFSWWLVPIIVAGVALILAPMIGAWWARGDMPMPEDRPNETLRSLRALYWRYIRGRRSP